MDQLGPNAFGEVMEPGRVADCYLGLLLPPPPAGELEAGTVLVVAPAALLHPGVLQPAGSLIYELLTGHPEREPGELVFVADLTGELRARPPTLGRRSASTPPGRAGGHRLLARWRRERLQVDDLSSEEARSLTRSAMTYVRGLATLPDTSCPDGGRSRSNGRSIRRSLPRYNFLCSSSTPPCPSVRSADEGFNAQRRRSPWPA